MTKATLKKALIDTLPIMTGYVFLGFGFGIIMKQTGYGLLWSAALSLFTFAGSMQYVTVGLLSQGVSLLTAALTTVAVNARHIFYGISMVDAYKGMGKVKPYLIFGLTDETYSLVARGTVPEGVDKKWYWFFVTLFDQSWWVLGTILGACVGSLLKINYEGIDFALTALFVTIFVEQWLSTKNHRPALIGVGASLACLLIFGADSFLIPAMAVIAGALIAMRRMGKEADNG